MTAVAPFNPIPDTSRPAPARLMPWQSARKKRLPDFITRPLFGKPLAPSAEEWQQLQDALWQGDPAMDKVVEWMFADGPRHTKPLFDQALEQGIDSLNDPPAALREFFALIDNDPPWLDRSLLEPAVQASHLVGEVSFFVLRDMALMGGYVLFNSMNQTLASSGSLRKDTSLRLGETGKWLNDVTEPEGLSRFGAGFKTTIRVRMVHALVRRNLQNKKDWDAARWGLPINQVDMTATYLAFGPVTLMGLRMFGAPVTPRQSKAAIHMWRYIGWLMGVDERWLAHSERDGLRKLYHTFMTHRLPDSKVRQLGEALRDEPLTRALPGLEGKPRWLRLVRWFKYQQHLSNSALILTFGQRRQLGLPLAIVPWYPLASAPLRFLTLSYYQLRGGKALEQFREQSRARQKSLLAGYFDGRQPDIIQPKGDHPAHL